MSFGKAFGLATCPLLFFTLPCSLGRPVQYSALLDLVFCSSKDYECDTASIYLSLQEWQADVQAFGLSSAYCASSAAVNVTGPVSICRQVSIFQEGLRPNILLFFTLSPFSDGCVFDRARNNLYVLARVVGSCHVGRPSAQYIFLLDLCLLLF